MYGEDVSISEVLFAIQGENTDIGDVIMSIPPDVSSIPQGEELKWMYSDNSDELYVWQVADLYGLKGWPHHFHVLEWIEQQGLDEPTSWGHAYPNNILDIVDESDGRAEPETLYGAIKSFESFCTDVKFSSGETMVITEWLDMFDEGY
jgi:hypothetical protein